jgi:hypothetical protein
MADNLANQLIELASPNVQMYLRCRVTVKRILDARMDEFSQGGVTEDERKTYRARVYERLENAVFTHLVQQFVNDIKNPHKWPQIRDAREADGIFFIRVSDADCANGHIFRLLNNGYNNPEDLRALPNIRITPRLRQRLLAAYEAIYAQYLELHVPAPAPSSPHRSQRPSTKRRRSPTPPPH